MEQLTDQNICILNLTSNDVRDFFLQPKNYFSLEIPTYFVFKELLDTLSEALLTDKYNNKENPLYESKKSIENIRQQNNVNYKLYSNKDGKYAWRPLQIINPAIYVALVHKITEENNWEYIQKRFQTFQENSRIECTSVPIKSNNPENDKANQIREWWEKTEQLSIELALEYEYLIKTDITDCYGSIYTHSIAWALHGKEEAKSNKRDRKLVGNVIDGYIQDMSNGQTNGIPQGSVLMDFIAEIVLGYADFELSNKIKESEKEIKDYHILIYRDYYRIFVNNPQDGEIITKLLSETIIDLGLMLNAHKTQSTHNVVRESIKPDKLFWITQHKNEKDLQKMLLIIHNLAEEFPNSGSLDRALCEYQKIIFSLKDIELPLPLISIVTDIAYHNPRIFPVFAAILHKFMEFIVSNDEKQKVLKKIQNRFRKIPNTGYLELWLQRISIGLDQQYPYAVSLSQLVSGKNIDPMWGIDGIDKDIQDIIKSTKIVDQNKINDLQNKTISADEFNIFHNSY
jgi:RNA-directed DNA polymerase